MKAIKARIKKGFESSCYPTREFTTFATSFKKRMSKILTEFGCTDIEFSVGHFYVSFCFTQSNGQTWYGALGDVRWFSDMYIRRTKQYKDYHGDCNININDLTDFQDILSRSFKQYANKPLYK